jgi:hypothetical protein
MGNYLCFGGIAAFKQDRRTSILMDAPLSSEAAGQHLPSNKAPPVRKS